MNITGICEAIYWKIANGSTIEEALAAIRLLAEFVGEDFTMTDDELLAAFAEWDARVHGDEPWQGENATVPGLRALFRFQ